MTRLTHLGLLYHDEQDLLTRSIPFVRQGLDRGEPVLVAQPQAFLDRLSRRFPGEKEITYVDIQEEGRNPGRILPWVLHSFALRHAGRRMRVLGEPIWPGRSALAYPACVQFESQVNLALSDTAITMLCTYDTSALPAQAINDSYYTHPLIVEGGEQPTPSPLYAEEDLPRHYYSPLPRPPREAERMPFGLDDLHAVRGLVAAQAGRVGMHPERSANLQLAATEAATNAILHGGGHGMLFVWSEQGCLVCEFQSNLPLPPPLAGSLQVPPTAVGGRGLSIINRLCDLVRWHASGDRCAVRMWLGLSDLHEVAKPALG